MQDLRFVRSTCDERYPGGMIENGERQGDPFGWWFGTIRDISYPSIFFREKFVPGEEGCGMPVWTDAQKDEIKDGESGRVFVCEFLDELFFVFVCEFFEVVFQGVIDRVDLGGWDGDFGEEILDTETVIGIFMVERNYSFIRVEDMPRY